MAFFLDALLIGVVWAILCIPVFTAGASTAALHRVAHNWMRNRSECTVKDFLAAFLSNFKKGTVIWLILLIPLALILFNVHAVWVARLQTSSLAKWLVLISGIIWVATATFAFSLQAIFENKPLRTVTNALRIAASYIVTSLILVAMFALSAFLTYLIPLGVVLFVPAGVFLSARPIWGVFCKVMEMPDVTTDTQGEI